MSSAVAVRNARRRLVKQQLRKALPTGPSQPPVRLLDPSRTGQLRVKAAAAVRARYDRLRSVLYQRIVLEDALSLGEDPPPWFVRNVFCPTGPGGGVDPTCSPGGSSRINSSAPKGVLEEVRRKGMTTGLEHSVLTDRSGNRLAEQSGTEGSTDVPTHALSNKPGADLVVTHNHPDSGPPSPQDLKMFGTHVGVGELNAVGHDGTVYVVRPVGDRDALYRAVDAYVLEVSGKIADKVVRSKNLTDEGRDALKRERDALLGKVAEEMESRGLVEYAVHRPTTDNEGNPAQPRDARGRWAAVGGHVLSALSRAGAYAGHLEHSAKSYVEDRLSAGVSKLPPGLQRAVHATVHVGRAGTRVAFASWTAGQALAERVSRERGSTPEQARRLRAVVGALDLATFKPVSIALAATGVSAATLGVASFVPPASAAYLAYSTARDPLATWRAAKGLVREAAGRIGHRLGFTGNSAEDVLGEVAAYLTRNDGDWPFAVLLAAVEEAGDLRRGLEVAREAVRAEPTGNAEETGGGYGVTDNALWDVLPTADKLKSFGQWLKDTALDLWRGLAEDLRGIADLAFRRGAGRAFDEARAGRFIDPNYRAGGREQFIDSVFRDQGNRDRFDALKKRIDDEAANHRDSVVEKIERSINDSVLNDRTPQQAWKEITTVIDREKDSAVTTVTDEVVRDQAEGQIAGFEEAGVEELFPLMEWTVHPEASKSGVCKRCMALKGTVWTITDARGKIPLHRNCVVGGSVVASGDALSVTKAHYTGQVVEVVTADGRRLTVTENHILLTEYGFLPARSIREGLHVLHAPGQFVDGVADPHDYRDVPCVADVFGALSESGLVVPGRVPVSPEDFHGDGGSLDPEVHVVRPDRQLWNESRTIPFREESRLVFGKVFRSGGLLAGDGAATQFLKRHLASSDRSVGRFRDALAILLGHLAQTHVSSLRPTPLGCTCVEKALVNRVSVAPELFRQCLHAHPALKQFADEFRIEDDPARRIDNLARRLQSAGDEFARNTSGPRNIADGRAAGIKFDRVVHVQRRHVANLPVYDLETRSTVYSVNGIITSNCKCSWTAREPAPPPAPRHPSPAPTLYAPGAGAKFKGNAEAGGGNCGTGAGGFKRGNRCAAGGGTAGSAVNPRTKKKFVKDTEPIASNEERTASLKQALAKIRSAPVPGSDKIVKMREALRLAREGKGRPGGDARGSAASRRQRARNLFAEFGGEERGYVVCPWTGLKMHWAHPDDAANNPHGYAKFEQGKIFTACQGGGYQLPNLLPESFAANRSRNDKRLRKENSRGC